MGMRGHHFYMGGVGMAAAICALETWSEKPLIWATIQFIAHGMRGDIMTLELERFGGGRSVVQAGAKLNRGDEFLQNTIAALGSREGQPETKFVSMPSVPPPNECAPKLDDSLQQTGNLIDQFERRIALEDSAAGLECMWIKPKGDIALSAPILALMSDFFLGAHPRTRGGTSLDNTFRLSGTAPHGWVLAVTKLSSFTHGTVHGTQYQYSEDGGLLSTSSQTGLLPRNQSS